MAKETNKVGLDNVSFLGLGEESGGEAEEVIVDDNHQEQEEEEETPSPESQKETQESESQEGKTSDEEIEKQEKAEETSDEESIEEDPEKTEASNEDMALFQSVAKEIGLEVEDDEDFKGINFDDPTDKDLSKFIDIASKKRAKKEFDSTFEKYPEAKGFLEYAKNGGDPRQYIETMYPQIDYSKVNYDEHVAESEQAQEQIVRNHLAAQETPEEEIEEMIEDFRNGGILDKQAKRSLGKLQQIQQKQQEKLIEDQKEAQRKRKEQAKKQQEKITSIIDEQEDIKGLRLPDTDKEDLKSYLFDPVDEEGRSQAFIDGNSMDEEERVAIAYLKMKGFDFSSLIESEAETQNAKRLKEQIRKSKDEKVSGAKREERERSTGNVQDIKPII